MSVYVPPLLRGKLYAGEKYKCVCALSIERKIYKSERKISVYVPHARGEKCIRVTEI